MSAPKDPVRYAEYIRRLSEAHKGKYCGEDNHNYGKPLPEETRKKISDRCRGRKIPEDVRKKISASLKGRPISEEHRQNISKAQEGRVVSEETRRRMSEAWKTRPPISDDTRQKLSNAMASVMKNQDTRQKISDAMRGNTHSKGDRNGNWNGGISFEPYCPKFNREFKERVRSFFGYRCAECGEPQNGYKLHVHHVNFNKMSCCDNTPPLFVPLCRSCHARTQKDRDYWEEHFTRMINEYHGGACYFPKEEAAT